MSDWGSMNASKMQDVLGLMAQRNAKNKDIMDTFTQGASHAADLMGTAIQQKSSQDFTANENQKTRDLQLQLPGIQAQAKSTADKQFYQFLKDQGINVGDNGYKYDFTDSYGRRWTSTDKGEHEMNLRTNDAWWQVYLARQGQNKDQSKDPNAWYLDTVGALQSVNKNDTTGVTDPLHQMDPSGLTKQFQTYLNTSGFDQGVQAELLKRFQDQIGNRGAKEATVNQGSPQETLNKITQLSQQIKDSATAGSGNFLEKGNVAMMGQAGSVLKSGNIGAKEREMLTNIRDTIGKVPADKLSDPQAYLNALSALDFQEKQLFSSGGDNTEALAKIDQLLNTIRSMAVPAGGF